MLEVSPQIYNGVQNEMTLSQYRFTASQNDTVASATYTITRNEFERNFYGGFVRASHAYYFASDNNPPNSQVRSFKVMRVCHNSNFSALYELSFLCGSSTPGSDVRISGVSVVDEDFGGLAGLVVILSRNRLRNSQQNHVCLYSLINIDRESKKSTILAQLPFLTVQKKLILHGEVHGHFATGLW